MRMNAETIAKRVNNVCIKISLKKFKLKGSNYIMEKKPVKRNFKSKELSDYSMDELNDIVSRKLPCFVCPRSEKCTDVKCAESIQVEWESLTSTRLILNRAIYEVCAHHGLDLTDVARSLMLLSFELLFSLSQQTKLDVRLVIRDWSKQFQKMVAVEQDVAQRFHRTCNQSTLN